MATRLSVNKSTQIKESGSDLLFNIANSIFLIFICLIILYPLIHIVSASLSAGDAIMAGKVGLIPVGFNLKAYQKVLEYQLIWIGFSNSLFYASVGTLVNISMTLIAAYPLSRADLPSKNIFLSLFVFTMMFSGGIIPTYLLVKDVGLLNTRWALIIPNAISVWNLLITISFFRTSIPIELYEAAQLDGASDFHYFIKIILPLSTPIIAVLTLYYAVGHWNQFFDAMLYLGKTELYPLQLILRQILIDNQVDLSLMADVREIAQREELQALIKYAVIVVTSLPVMLIYPFAQKYFIKGITLGAVKG
jgi:multiple sugar transport system permease protein/putative aldouronate transport system permease protein